MTKPVPRRGAADHAMSAFRGSRGLDFQGKVMAAVAVALAIVLVLLEPWLAWQGPIGATWARLLGGVITLGLIIFVIAHFMQRQRLGGFRGTYTYESQGPRGRRYAVARISAWGMRIVYRVDFFASEGDRARFLSGAKPRPGEEPLRRTGYAEGISADKTMHPKERVDELWIMYEGSHGDEEFYGVVRLSPSDANSWSTLTGRWYRLSNPDPTARPVIDNVLTFTRVTDGAAAPASGPGTQLATVKIIGLGLVGGSLARLLSTSGISVIAWDTDKDTRLAARAEGIAVADSYEALLAAPADLALVASPIDALPTIFADLAASDRGCLVADVGSVKGWPLQWARDAGLAGRYVGLHPMSGLATTGFAASDAQLYVGVPWVVVPTECPEQQVCEVIELLCTVTKARVYVTDALTHDRCAAMISHVPHVIANTLLDAVGADPSSQLAFAISAGSFRDMTRVGGTDTKRTANMLIWNRDAVASVVGELEERLEDTAALLASGADDLPFLDEAQSARTRMESRAEGTAVHLADGDAVAGLTRITDEGKAIVSMHPGTGGWDVTTG